MACTVEWEQQDRTVHVIVTGTIDGVTARRVSAAIASHVGIDGVDVIEVDTSAAEISGSTGGRVLEELSRRFAGAGQKLVIRDAALEGDRARALR